METYLHPLHLIYLHTAINMNTNTKTETKVHNSHKNKPPLPLIAIFIVILIFSAVTIYIVTSSPINSTIHVRNEKELTNAINNAPTTKPTTIILNKDIKLKNPLLIPNNKNITLTSNTKFYHTKFYKLIGTNKQQQKETITIEEGGVLRLSGIIVTHTKNANGTGVTVNEGGKLDMTNGEISDNHAYAVYTILEDNKWTSSGGSGGGVYNLGVFTMSGGTISDNTANPGDAIFVAEKWQISDSFGGGVYNLGVFEMSGGAILGNDAYGDGGGVFVAESGFFNMSGDACIASNGASAGGGVCVQGVFVMSGGKIFDNAASFGGGVRVDTGGTFNMTGNAEITNNIVGREGGGVYVGSYFNLHGSTFYMSDNAIIANNKADQGGGGVYVYNGQFELSDGKIRGNTACDGGGICNYGNVTMISGEISNNTASAGGGGVFNYNGPPKWTEVPEGSFVYSFFKMAGGEITNNTADNGGGIFDCLGTFSKIGGGVIANNKAANVGNDICRPDDLS